MKKERLIKYLLGWFIASLYLFTACDENHPSLVDRPDNPLKPEEVSGVKWKLLKEFTFAELKTAEKGLGLSAFSLIGNTPVFDGDIQLRAFKVMYSSANPNGSDEKITLSGVLLVPPAIDSATLHRQILAPPYTYVLDKQAPTRQLTDYDASTLEAYLIFWMWQASKGYVVMIPDYPGFGDSYGKCFIPYIEKKSMVRTTIDFVRASQKVLQENHYAKKKNMLVTGYSLGGFVATQVARELETNLIDGLTVDLLLAGGTPCLLKDISDEVRTSETMPEPYLLPLAIYGYKKNGYHNLDVRRLLREPYASRLAVYFDGQSHTYKEFPDKTHDLFTDAFIHNTNQANEQIDAILEANSLKPWTNRCEFVLIHGKDDRTVHFENAQAYAAKHRASGGKVTFIDVPGDHPRAGISYFIYLMSYLPKYK
ncbi:S9 family peptidase [Tannerella sp.]|uniref:alpha/beta hydrolase family protein n=1 Tax=Tannerella sp. TaxID=2382127 RepID=UPI0026DC688C|nr:alpha/beta hydrolase [Tannerella sp.]MDO4702579.1 alpha/beta hydrolase [Tannerella sp.]